MGLSAAARVGMLTVVACILFGLVILQIGKVGPDAGIGYRASSTTCKVCKCAPRSTSPECVSVTSPISSSTPKIGWKSP